MLPENIIGKEGKSSRMDPKARPAKILASEGSSEKRGGEPKQLQTGAQPFRKPPGPRPAKKT